MTAIKSIAEHTKTCSTQVGWLSGATSVDAYIERKLNPAVYGIRDETIVLSCEIAMERNGNVVTMTREVTQVKRFFPDSYQETINWNRTRVVDCYFLTAEELMACALELEEYKVRGVLKIKPPVQSLFRYEPKINGYMRNSF